MRVTDKAVVPLPEGTSRRLVSMILGFGVGVGLAAALFLGAKRIPGFEPLIAIFPEEHQTLLIPFSSLLIGLVALAIEFYAGEAIARRSIRKSFGMLLLIVITSILTLLVTYVLFVRKVYNPIVEAYEMEIIGWSRLPPPFCNCPPGNDVECIEGISYNIETCWSGRSIIMVKLALFFSYLIAIEGFAVLAGLLVLRPPKRQKPNFQPESLQPQKTEQPEKGTTKGSRTSKPVDPSTKPKKPKTGTPASRAKKPKPPE